MTCTMFGTCLVLAWHLLSSCSALAWYPLSICSVFAWHLVDTCFAITRHLLGTWLTLAQDLLSIWLALGRDLLSTCSALSQHLLWICSGLAEHLLSYIALITLNKCNGQNSSNKTDFKTKPKLLWPLKNYWNHKPWFHTYTFRVWSFNFQHPKLVKTLGKTDVI